MDKKRAFTLIEILLALAILGVGLVGVLSVFASASNAVRRTVEAAEAGTIAQMVSDKKRLEGYSGAGSETITSFTDSDGHSIYPGWVCEVQVSAAGSMEGLKVMQIGVRYKSRDILSLTTYITKYEP